MAGGFRQPKHIVGERVDIVTVQVSRLVAEVVADLVRDKHAPATIGQRPDLIAPRVVEFREAVKQDDERAVFRSFIDGGQLAPAVTALII